MKLIRTICGALLLLLGLCGAASAQGVCPTAYEPAVLKSATRYDIKLEDGCQLLTFTSASSIAVTLPDPSVILPVGWRVAIKAEGSGTVTVTPNGGRLIDGMSSKAIPSGGGLHVWTDHTDFYTIVGFPPGNTLGSLHCVLIGEGSNPINSACPGGPGIPLISTGPSTDPVFGPLDLAVGVMGTLTVSNGGTGEGSLALNCVLIGEGTAPINGACPGGAGFPLISHGSGIDPSFQGLPVAAIIGVLPVPNGGTGDAGLGIHCVLLGENTDPVMATCPGAAGFPLVSRGSSIDPIFQSISVNALTGVLPPVNGGTGDSGLGLHCVLIGENMGPIQAACGSVAGQVLTWNASGDPSFQGSGTLINVGLSVPGASIFGVTGSPLTGSGGTLGLTTTGTQGGIPYFNSTSTLASSALLGTVQLVVGGGSGGPPGTIGSVGTTTTVLHGNAAGLPFFASVSNADLANANITVNGTTCTLGSSCNPPGSQPAAAFGSSGTHTILASNEKVTVCGPGGGAGGSLIDTSSPGGGGGGGGGAVATKWLTGLTVGATLTVTIGNVGSGGTFGTTGGAVPTDGGNATSSSVSSGSQSIATITAGGGGGGGHGVVLADTSGGVGGGSTGGDINSPGQSGDSGLSGGAMAPSGFAQSVGFMAGGMSGCPFGIWGVGGRSTGAGASAAGSGESGHPGIVVFEGG